MDPLLCEIDVASAVTTEVAAGQLSQGRQGCCSQDCLWLSPHQKSNTVMDFDLDQEFTQTKKLILTESDNYQNCGYLYI